MANRKNSQQDNALNVFRKSDGRPVKHRQLRAIALSIAIGILVFAVAIAIYIGVKNIINSPSGNNFSVEEHDGETYYVMHGNYGGEYVVQHADLEHLHEGYEWRDVSEQSVMSYDEYAQFCDKWRIQQRYSDAGKKYSVVGKSDAGSVVDASLAGVAYSGDTAELYVWDEARGSVGGIDAYVIVVPISNREITSVKVIDTLDESEWGNIINPSSTFYNNPNLPMADKPIIYLYPTADTNVTVKLGKPEELAVSYPTYNANTGWRVLAKPSGELVDLSSGRNLYSLYYESNLLDSTFKVNDDGFIVRREDITSFLEDKLAKLGLNEYEAEEFIVYWLPRLSEHDYNYIRFATIDEINQVMPLDINPTPDTIIRVLMTYKGLDEPLTGIKEQQLPPTPARTGFTAVEWGGSEIKD